MVLLLAVLMALTHARELKIDHGNLESYSSTTTLSLNDTLTVTKFMTTSTTTSSVPQSTTSQQNSDSGVFAVFAFNPGTPIHMQWMQAAGNSFWVGGEPATYCPSTVQEQGGCPPGNYTALSSCGMVSGFHASGRNRPDRSSPRRYQVASSCMQQPMVNSATQWLTHSTHPKEP